LSQRVLHPGHGRLTFCDRQRIDTRSLPWGVPLTVTPHPLAIIPATADVAEASGVPSAPHLCWCERMASAAGGRAPRSPPLGRDAPRLYPPAGPSLTRRPQLGNDPGVARLRHALGRPAGSSWDWGVAIRRIRCGPRLSRPPWRMGRSSKICNERSVTPIRRPRSCMIAGGLRLRSPRRWWSTMEGTVRHRRETQSRNTQSRNTHKMMTMGILVWSIRTSAPRI
jgi:hypothetical protein